MKKKYYTAQQICNILGISKKTLFLWEAKGKIPKAKRNGLFNYRIYTEKDIAILKEIARTKWKREGKDERRKKIRKKKD